MLARIAREVEQYRPGRWWPEQLRGRSDEHHPTLTDTLAMSLETVVDRLAPALVVVPTRSGFTARHVTRHRLPTWILALCGDAETAKQLQFSWGVHPAVQEPPADWRAFIRRFLDEHGLEGNLAVVVAGPSETNPEATYRMELIELGRQA